MIGFAYSGGGSRAAYHVGVIRATAEMIAKGEMSEPVAHFGTSAGAAVAGIAACESTMSEAHDRLDSVFLGLRTKDVYRNHLLIGKIAGLFFKPSFYTQKRFAKLLRAEITTEELMRSGKRLAVGAVNELTGEHEVFTEKSPHIIDAILASGAFPSMFEPIFIDGVPYSDGGVRAQTPAISKLIDMGCDEIVISICHPRELPGELGSTAPARALRAIDIMAHTNTWNDVQKAKLYNDAIANGHGRGKRHIKLTVIHPKEVLTPDTLDFDPKQSRRVADMGYHDAMRAYENRG